MSHITGTSSHSMHCAVIARQRRGASTVPTNERYPYQVFACRGLTSSRCTSKSSPSAVYKSQARQLLQNARRRDFELGAELVPRARESRRNLIISHQAEEGESTWGYDRIVGALANLGRRLSDQTVGNILRRHGVPPAPKRKHTTSWKDFHPRSHGCS